jgi:hypothetical protein
MQRDPKAPRPRPSCRRPAYPRCVGVAMLVLVSAGCGKTSVDRDDTGANVRETHDPLLQPPGIEAIPFDAAPAASSEAPTPPASAVPTPSASAVPAPSTSAASTRPATAVPPPPVHPKGSMPAPFEPDSDRK